MPVRPIDEALADLAKHLRPLSDLMDEAHEEFKRELRGVAHKLDARSKASIYRDLIVRNLRAYCDEHDGATTHKKGQLTLIGLENSWLLRVKKLGQGFGVAASKTRASKEYDSNVVPESIQSELSGMEAATCLYFGWNVPENAPGAINKFLVCNDENRQLAWMLPLGDAGTPPVVIQPLPIEPPPAPDEVRRVRVKGAALRKDHG